MNLAKYLSSSVMLLIATLALAGNTAPANNDAAKPFYLIDAKLTEKSNFWNFCGKDEEICNPRIITTQGDPSKALMVKEFQVGDLPEKLNYGVTMNFVIKPDADGLRLSGNIIIRPGIDMLKNDNNGKSWTSIKTSENWFFVKLDKLPQTIEVPDVKYGNTDFSLVITVSPSDGKQVIASPPVKNN